MVTFNTKRVLHVYDPEASLHCFERLLVRETLTEGVLTSNDEGVELAGEGSSFCLKDTAIPVCPDLDVLGEHLRSFRIEIVHYDYLLSLVSIKPLVA